MSLLLIILPRYFYFDFLILYFFIAKYIANAENVLKYRTKLTEGDLGAFRRFVITTAKAPAIQKDFEAEMIKLHARNEYLDTKVIYKKGVQPNTLVVDINGDGATSLASKFKGLIGRNDKDAVVKLKNTTTSVPVKKVNESKLPSDERMKYHALRIHNANIKLKGFLRHKGYAV